VLAAAFLFLLGATAAVAIGQFTASRVAPWLSMGYSAGAVVCTVLALIKRQPS
jgi:purine-cytosine permease-like protein